MVKKTASGYELEESDIHGPLHTPECDTRLSQAWYFSIDTWYKIPVFWCKVCKVSIPILPPKEEVPT